MKVIKNEIRPIGFVTIELNENEVHTIIGCMDEIAMYRREPYGKAMGNRGEIYNKLKALLSTSQE